MSENPSDPSDRHPLDYQSPVAPDAGRSQWITDEHASSKWIAGCLIIGTTFGTIVGGIFAALTFAVGC